MSNNYTAIKEIFIEDNEVSDFVNLDKSTLAYHKILNALQKPLKLILFYGKPGCGKTFLLNKIKVDLEKKVRVVFVPQPFLTDQANRIAREAEKLFGDKIDFPFSTAPDYGVFRNPENRKWYGIIMNIPKSKIEKQGRAASLSADDAIVEIINVKIDPEKSIELKKRRGFYDAYHMSKKNWITIALDGSVSDGLIVDLLKKSRALVSPRPCHARS